MYLEDIHLRMAPGLPEGLDVTGLAPGLNVVVGPNASGKSTLGRTVRGLLWPQRADGRTVAETTWQDGAGGRRAATLLGGRAEWSPEAPALPPGEAGARYALDIVTLLRARDADHALAREIAVELAGGYDLDAARDGSRPTTRLGNKLRRERKEAKAALARAESNAEQVASEEARLPGLKVRLKEAREARRRVGFAERAVEAAEARADRDVLAARVETFPDGLEALRGDEEEQVRAARERCDDVRKELSVQAADQEAAEGKLEANRFEGEVPEPDAVEAWRERLRDLEDDERSRARLDREVEALRRKEREARRAILDERAPERAPTGDDLHRLDGLLHEHVDAEARVAAEVGARKAWERHATAETDDPDRVRRGLDVLRAWLRTPGPEARPRERGVPVWVGWLVLAVGGLGIAAGLLLAAPVVGGAGLVAAGVGLGLVVATLVARRGPEQPDAREVHRREASTLGVEPPAWSEEGVRRHLDDLEGRWSRAVAAARAREEAEAAEGREVEARQALETTAARCRRALVEMGFRDAVMGLPTVQLAAAVRGLVEARLEREAKEAERDACGSRVRRGLGDVGGWLRRFGRDAPGDVADARVAVEAVERQRTAWSDARERLADLGPQIERTKKRLGKAEAELEAVYERAGVASGDDAGLAERLRLHGEWRQVGQELRAAEARLAGVEPHLAGAPEDLVGLGAEEALRVLEAAREQAERYDELHGRVIGIDKDVEAAMEGSTLEEARAVLDDVEARIAAERDDRMVDLLTELVLDDAERSHRDDHAPALLQKARRWFARFTHHAWALEVDSRGVFRARDVRQGARRGLDQLSDATRIHLLLAARLAAIEEAEGGGEVLPLCLDEVLSTTDPTRFRQVVEALIELSEAGRQIIYFTADRAEVEAWRSACRALGRDEPNVVDLGDLARAPEGWGEAPVPEPVQPRVVPAPDGHDATEYARVLGVRRPDPRQPAASWHLLYLLYDDLDALHRCLRAGLDCLGAWRHARETRLASVVLDGAGPRVDLRARLVEEVVEAWRVGRGRPVTWADVEASGAVSETFEDRARALLDDHGDDPEAYVRAVGDLPRFHTRKQEELRTHLEEVGAIDPRDPLDEDAIAARALGRVRNALEATGADVAEADAYVRWLLRIANGDAAESPRGGDLPSPTSLR
ncbi:MAG: hypothetical protein ACQEXJ_04985 [Myxococcota bacterium]